MKNHIVKYVRKNPRTEVSFEPETGTYCNITHKGNPVGCLFALKEDVSDTIFIGWSYCHKKDILNKKFGRKIAYKRAKLISSSSYASSAKIPYLVEKELNDFLYRCRDYFKSDTFDVFGVGLVELED